MFDWVFFGGGRGASSAPAKPTTSPKTPIAATKTPSTEKQPPKHPCNPHNPVTRTHPPKKPEPSPPKVRVLAPDASRPDGRREVAVLGRGQFVGERAVINDRLRSADCVAQGRVQVGRGLGGDRPAQAQLFGPGNNRLPKTPPNSFSPRNVKHPTRPLTNPPKR